MRDVDDALKALYAKRPTVIKPGLSRIERALAALGVKSLACVLIGGTNGKGTTAGRLFRLLTASGVNTGLFTSPHLVDFNERIVTSSGAVTDAELVDELDRLIRELPESVYEPMSFFEVNTVLALRVFRRRQTQFDVLEVGLGGRFDATNAVDPDLSIITSIGLDHQDLLGDTTAKIAFEKAGIMRPGKPVFWSGQGDPAACAVIEAEAKRQGANLLTLGKDFRESDFALPSGPRFLRQNYALAHAAFSWITGQKNVEGADSVPLPAGLRARFELIERFGKRFLLDVGHNPDGIKALLTALDEVGWIRDGKKIPMIVSVLADKDCDGILDLLRPHAATLVLFAARGERAWHRERLAERHRDLPWARSFRAAAFDERMTAGPTPILVCGSVHALGEVLGCLDHEAR